MATSIRVGCSLAVIAAALVPAVRANDMSGALLGSVRAHDPSSIVSEAGRHYTFTTGWGIRCKRSDDLVHWVDNDSVFARDATPDWIQGVTPEFRGRYWAPDALRVGDQWLVYYSVSRFGKQTSAIGLATSPTLDSTDPAYAWTDHGAVIQSQQGAPFNAIDPSVLQNRDGRLWMAFGSFWEGIYLIELDAQTGGALTTAAPPKRLAWAEAIEAPTLLQYGNHYYLFVNHGRCCAGVDSTYRVLVGRSDSVTGPYRDRDGRSLLNGGGSLVLGSEGKRIGPGHIAPLRESPSEKFGFHYYDGEDRGRSKLGLGEWTWSEDGWPIATAIALASGDAESRAHRLSMPARLSHSTSDSESR